MPANDPLVAEKGFRATVLPRLLAAALAVMWIALVALQVAPILRGNVGDFYHFYEAARAMSAGEDIYLSGRGGYIYPPLVAFLFQPLSVLSAEHAALGWLLINATLTALALFVCVREMLRRFSAPLDLLTVSAVALLTAVLTADKIKSIFNLGQTDVFMILGFALGLRWLDRRPLAAGIALGVAASVKYLSIIALPYLILRRRWRAAAGLAISFAAMMLLPALSTGWDVNAGYVSRAFSGMTRMLGLTPASAPAANVSLVTWDRSVSVTSAFMRAVGPDGSRALAALGVGAVAAATLALCWWIFRRRGFALWIGRSGIIETRPPLAAVVALEWTGLIVASVVFSPQTEARHMVVLMIAASLSAVLLLVPRVGVGRGLLLAGVIIAQLGLLLPPGGESWRQAQTAWRGVGGASWCVLVMYAILLWTGLKYARAVADGAEFLDPPPGYDRAGRPR